MADSWLSWLLILEIVFPLLLLSIVLIVILVRGKARFKDAMRELIINVKDNEPIQKEATQRFLRENIGLDNAAVEKVSSDIIRERKFFIRTFVSSILNKDVENLATLDDELSRIIEKYHALQPEIAKTSDQASEAADDDKADALRSELETKQAQIEELREESKSLKQEIHITLSTLNSIFAEYSSMFGEETPQKDMSVEQILTAMESFSSGDDFDDDETMNDPVDVSQPQVETESSEDLELDDDDEQSDDGVSLDDMPLEDISKKDDDAEDEPSWEDAFSESGDEMDKKPE